MDATFGVNPKGRRLNPDAVGRDFAFLYLNWKGVTNVFTWSARPSRALRNPWEWVRPILFGSPNYAVCPTQSSLFRDTMADGLGPILNLAGTQF